MAFDTNSWLGDVILGGALVAVGVMLTSWGWHFIGKCKKKRIFRYIINAILVILIVGGPVIIGVGGTLTTLGWNKKDNDQQKKALIRAVAQEWVRNQLFLTDGPFAGVLYDDKGKVYFYPMLKKFALSRTLASGIFSFDNQKEALIFATIADYEYSIETLNNALTHDNINLITDKTTAEELYELVIDSHRYKRFVNQNERMRKLLVNNYSGGFLSILIKDPNLIKDPSKIKDYYEQQQINRQLLKWSGEEQ